MGGSDSVAPPADPMARIDAANAKPQVAFHSERLTEQLGGPELRFNWHSPEVGGIELSTSLRHHEVQMAITTERAETATAMRGELPSLDSRLQEHSLSLGEVSIVAQERALSTGLGMENQQRGQHEWTRNPAPAAEARISDSGESVGPISTTNGRVSVLA
jgi:flagellar hook-length control protein FliK